MAAGHKVGTIFAEVGLDFTPYTRAQKRLLKDATTTTLNIEKSYKDLGIKSSKEFDLMRAKISNSYERITKDATTSAADILRAEKAKNEQLKRINDQQYGHQKTLTEKIKANWLGIAAVATAAYLAYQKIGVPIAGLIKDSTMLAARYETLGIVMEVVGKNTGVGADQMHAYSKALMATGISAVESRQNLVRMSQASIDLASSTKLARVAQDAAVIGMMNSSEAFNNMIYGIQSANVRVLRTIGINVSFENSYKTLAEQLGKTTDDLSEQEKVQARVNAVLEAGTNIAGSYEASMATASKQIYSMQRYLEDFKVSFGEAFQPALIEMVKASTSAIFDMKKVVEDPSFRGALTDIGNAFGIMIVQLAKLIPLTVEYSNAWIKTWQALGLASAGVISYKDAITNGVDAVDRFNKGISQQEKFFKVVDYKQQGIYLEKYTKTIEKIDPIIVQITASEKKAAKESQKLTDDLWQFKVKAAVEADKEMADAYALYVGYENRLNKESEKSAADKAKAYRNMYKDMKDMAGQNYEYELDLLKKQRDEYIKLTGEKNTADKWFSEQYQKLLIENYKASDDFVKGVQAGFMQLTREQYTWGQAGYDTVMTFRDAGISGLSEFFDYTSDSFLSLDDLWKGIVDSMLQAWANMLAQMVMQWAMSGIAGLVTGGGLGGFSLTSLIGGGSTAAGVGAASGVGAAGVGAAGAGAIPGLMAPITTPAIAPIAPIATDGLSAGAGYGSLAGIGAAIAAPIIWGQLGLGEIAGDAMRDLFGSNPEAPGSAAYLKAWEAGDLVVPGFEDKPASQGGYGWRDLVSTAPWLIDTWKENIIKYADPAGAHAEGGILKARDMLNLGSGEPFFRGMPGEGVVSHRGMKALERLNSGEVGGETHVHLYIDGREIGYTVADQTGKNVELISALRRAVA